jgi:hypothetical protein
MSDAMIKVERKMKIEPREMNKVAAALERHAIKQSSVVKQAIREYKQSLRTDADDENLEKRREVERVVSQYMQIRRMLDRLYSQAQRSS